MATGRPPATPDSGLALEPPWRCWGSNSSASASAFSSPLLCPNRLRENKEALRELNGRLAACLGRRRQARARRGQDEDDGEDDDDGEDEDDGGEPDRLRRRYEGELAEARRALDQQALQRASLQAALEGLRQEHRHLQTRSSKKENNLSLAIDRVRDLEAQLNSKEADLRTLLGKQQRLENRLQELNNQTISLQEIVKDSKNKLQNERLRSMDLENQVKSLEGQVMFLKNLHEEELKRKKCFYESKIQDIQSCQQQDFESKLLNALHDLRKEHEQQVQAYKDQMERNFQAKIENVQLSATKNSDFADSVLEELEESKRRVDFLISQNGALEAQTRALEAKLRELQETVHNERDLCKRHLAEKEEEMMKIQQQMQTQLEEYELLLDVKLALDLEISTYRAMLEGEEKRLKLFRTSSESSGAEAPIQQGSHPCLQGRKRKRSLPKKRVYSMTSKVVQRASSTGSISIEDIDPEGKFIKIKNNSDKDQLLTGWTVRRHRGNESDIMYQFPARFILQADQLVTIWSARDSPSQDQKTPILESQKPCGVGEIISIILLNADGKETAEGKITCVDRGEGEGELEELTEEKTTKLCCPQNETHSCPIM